MTFENLIVEEPEETGTYEATREEIWLRGKNKGGSKFVPLEARQSNKEKGFKGKGSTSKSMDDEAGDKEHLAVESVVQDRTVKESAYIGLLSKRSNAASVGTMDIRSGHIPAMNFLERGVGK